MNKKLFKVVMVILVAILCIATTMNLSADAFSWSGKIADLDATSGDGTLNSKITFIVGAAISVVRIVAVGVAIIMIIAVAMKYMTAAPGDRADIKKHAVPFVVGAIVLFASSGILGIIAQFADNIHS